MNWRTDAIPMQIAPVCNGVQWRLCTAEYETAEGKFEFHFYAVSMEHASHVLGEIKATATLSGMVDGWMPA